MSNNDYFANEKNIAGDCSHKHHPGAVDLSTFEYKGCWSCWRYFKLNDKLVSIKDAAKIVGVSTNTIRRKLKAGEIEGKLFKRTRSNWSPPPQKTFIYKPSLKNIM